MVLSNRYFAIAALSLGGGLLAHSQVLIERGVVTGAGAAAGAGAGRGVVGVFRSLDTTMNQAGAQSKGQPDKKEKSIATASDKLPPSKPASAETMSKVRIAGAGADIPAPAPAASAPGQPGQPAQVSEPAAADAPAAAQALPVTDAAPAVPAAPEPPGPPLIACDFEMLAAGISREDLIAQVGKPQTRLKVTDSRGDSEVYRYKLDGVEVAVVKLRGGVVDSIETIEYWKPKPLTPVASPNVIKVAGLQ